MKFDKLYPYLLIVCIVLGMGMNHPLRRASIAQQTVVIGDTDTWTANNTTLSAYDGNLIDVYHLEETGASNRVGSLNGYDALAVSSPTNEAGKYNNALTTDGVADYVQVPTATYDYAALLATRNFTLSFWFKHTTTGYKIISGSYNGGGWDIAANQAGVGSIQVNLYGGTGGNLSYVGSLNDGAWHLLTLTCNSGTSIVTLYTDGVSRDTLGSVATIFDANERFMLGANYQGGLGFPYPGAIDECVWWDTDIGSTAATAHYNSGTGAFFK